MAMLGFPLQGLKPSGAPPPVPSPGKGVFNITKVSLLRSSPSCSRESEGKPRMAPAPFSQKRLTAEKEALYNGSPFCCKALNEQFESVYPVQNRI